MYSMEICVCSACSFWRQGLNMNLDYIQSSQCFRCLTRFQVWVDTYCVTLQHWPMKIVTRICRAHQSEGVSSAGETLNHNMIYHQDIYTLQRKRRYTIRKQPQNLHLHNALTN